MLSFRKLAIFCILVASVHLVRCAGGLQTDQELECYKQLVKSLGKIVSNENLPEYVTVAYKSTDLLEKLSPEFQSKCVNTWNQGMRQAIWEIVSKSQAEAKDEIIYKAFDTVIRQSVTDLQNELKIKKILLEWQFELMLADGNILEFLAFREQFPNENKEKIQNEKNALMKEYKKRGMEDEEAELCAILHNYDSGILGEKCFGGETSKSSKPPGIYKSIKKRFKKFKTRVEEGIKNPAWPKRGITQSFQINDLDKVAHDIKLHCLMEFYRKSRDEKQRPQRVNNRQKQKYAYEALESVCTFYFEDIENRIKTHSVEIVKQMKLKFTHEMVISFLVFENNPDTIDGVFMANEINRLVEVYKKESMSEEEAKLWVIFNGINKDIIGKYYDGPPQEPTPKSRSCLACLHPKTTN